MDSTVVGVFDNPSEVQLVVDDLLGLGLNRDDIDVIDQMSASTIRDADYADTTASMKGGMFSGLHRWLSGLGLADNDRDCVAESVRRGGTMIAANADDSQVEEIAEVMQRHGAIDMDQRSEYYKKSGFQSFDTSAPAYSRDESIAERERFAPGGQFAIPVVKESVKVGKKKIDTGRVRITTRVSETPVEENLRLREEHVDVERTPVDRPLNASDMDTFKEGNLDITESSEIPVVNKEARVVEEVKVKKDVNERSETVRETTRRRDVDVERVDEGLDVTTAKIDRDRTSTDTGKRTTPRP